MPPAFLRPFGEGLRIDPDVRFVVTGPTGWIGRSMLAWLAQALGAGWTERVTAFASRDGRLAIAGEEIVVRPLPSLKPADVDGAVLLHFAFLGLEQAASRDFVSINTRIDDAVLDGLASGAPRGVFVSSSGMARETASGANRNLYGAAKLMQEARFLAYAQAHPVRALVGRVFNVAGPYVNKLENYALSDFLVQAFSGGPVQVKASVPVFRSYLHVFDLAALVVGELLGDNRLPLRPIDLCGPEVVEMQDVAMAAAEAAKVDFRLISRPPIEYGRRNSYVGDFSDTGEMALRNGLSLMDFKRQVADTADYLIKLRGGSAQQ